VITEHGIMQEASAGRGECGGFNEKNNAIIGGEGNGGIIYRVTLWS
jgi:hypothetical protein